MEQAAQTAPILTPADARPVDRPERITAIDSLRGFALLGILLMNIVGMGLYGSAYDDPTVTGGATGANLGVWTVMHVLAEGKMRCLFSMVFGASVLLLTGRLADRRDAADIYYRRTLWLLLFGLVHGFLLWSGDILYPYALCGLALYPFRNLRARTLLILGSIMLIGNSALYIKLGFDRRAMIEDGRAAETMKNAGRKLTDTQQEALTSYERWHKRHYPDAAALNKMNQEWRGSPLQVIGMRAQSVMPWHSQPYYGAESWDIFSMMFIGMALMNVIAVVTAIFGAAYAVQPGYGIGFSKDVYLWIPVLGNIVAVLVIPFVGNLSDKIGRRPLIIGSALLTGLLSFAYLYAISIKSVPLAIAMSLLMWGVIYQGYNAIFPSFYPELFPTRTRVSAMAIAQNIGTAITAMLPAIFATVAPPGSTNIPVIIGSLTFGIAIIAAIAAFTARETYRVHMNDLGDRNAVPVDKETYERTRERAIADARLAHAPA